MQRAFPTDPSRSVDFDGHRDAARGAAGAGSDKLVRLDESLLSMLLFLVSCITIVQHHGNQQQQSFEQHEADIQLAQNVSGESC